VFGLLGYRMDNDNAMKKYSCANEESKVKLPPQFGSIFRPKLRIFVYNVAFLGMTLKPKLQEVLPDEYTCKFSPTPPLSVFNPFS